MAKGWSNNRRCPIYDGSGWGKNRCRGFLHQDGSAVFCEWPRMWNGPGSGYEITDTQIAPFGILLTCFREILE